MFFSLSTQGSLIISLSNTSDLQFPQSAMNTRRGRGWRCSISAATKLLRLSYLSSFPTLSICCYFQSQNLRGLERAPIAQLADIGFKVVLLERLNQKWKQKHF